MPTADLPIVPGASAASVASSVTWTPSTDHMVHGKRYAFFLRESLADPSPTYYTDILKSATSKVYIWDPYFWSADTAIFDCFRHQVEVTVLTSKSKQKTTYLQELIDETRNQLDPSAAGSTFKFGFIDTDKYGKQVLKSHDRFLILDDNECYLIGASVEYHRRTMESTGIYHIEHQKDRDVIKAAFNKVLAICERDGTCKIETI